MPRIERLTTSAAAEGLPLLQDITLALDPGEVHGILGPSGSGKTLLTMSLRGLVPLATGGIVDAQGGAVRVAVVPADAPPGDIRVRELAALTGGEPAAVAPDLCGMSVARMPRGLRQRTLLTLFASSNPGLLLVDDPEFGSVEEVCAWRDALLSVATCKVPVLLLSRSEVPLALLCGQLHILFDGRVIASGATQALVPGACVLARKRYS